MRSIAIVVAAMGMIGAGSAHAGTGLQSYNVVCGIVLVILVLAMVIQLMRFLSVRACVLWMIKWVPVTIVCTLLALCLVSAVLGPAIPTTVIWSSVGAFVVCMVACAIVSTWCKRTRRDGHCLVRAAVLLAMVGACVIYLRWDAPAPMRKYSLKDIPDPVDAAKAKEIMMQICKCQPEGTVSAIVPYTLPKNVEDLRGQLSSTMDVALVVANCAAIEQTWNSVSNYHNVMRQLDQFVAVPATGYRIYDPLLNFLALRNYAQILALHVRAQAFTGDAGVGVSNLVEFYSVVRKALPHANNIVYKMVWIACAGLCIDTAAQIATQPETKPETLRALAAAFAPLRVEEITLRSAFVGEICGITDLMDSIETNRSVSVIGELGSDLPRWLELRVFYNHNATVRDYLGFMERMVENTSRLPMEQDTNICTALEVYMSKIQLKNIAGRSLVNCCTPNFYEAVRKSNIRKVKSDLLAVYLGMRLNTPCAVKNMYTGKEYPVDEKTGMPFCPLPDGPVTL